MPQACNCVITALRVASSALISTSFICLCCLSQSLYPRTRSFTGLESYTPASRALSHHRFNDGVETPTGVIRGRTGIPGLLGFYGVQPGRGLGTELGIAKVIQSEGCGKSSL